MPIATLLHALRLLQPSRTENRIHATVSEDDACQWRLQFTYPTLTISLEVEFEHASRRPPRVHILSPRLRAPFIHHGAVCLVDFGVAGGFRYTVDRVVSLMETLYARLDPTSGDVVIPPPPETADGADAYTTEERQAGDSIIRQAHSNWQVRLPAAADIAAHDSDDGGGGGGVRNRDPNPVGAAVPLEPHIQQQQPMSGSIPPAATPAAPPAVPPVLATRTSSPSLGVPPATIFDDGSTIPPAALVGDTAPHAPPFDAPEAEADRPTPTRRQTLDYSQDPAATLEDPFEEPQLVSVIDVVPLPRAVTLTGVCNLRIEGLERALSQISGILILDGTDVDVEIHRMQFEGSIVVKNGAKLRFIDSAMTFVDHGLPRAMPPAAIIAYHGDSVVCCRSSSVVGGQWSMITYGDTQIEMANCHELGGPLRFNGGRVLLRRCMVGDCGGIEAVNGCDMDMEEVTVTANRSWSLTHATTHGEDTAPLAVGHGSACSVATRAKLRATKCHFEGFNDGVCGHEASHLTLTDCVVRYCHHGVRFRESYAQLTRCRILHSGQVAAQAHAKVLLRIAQCRLHAENNGLEASHDAKVIAEGVSISAFQAIHAHHGSNVTIKGSKDASGSAPSGALPMMSAEVANHVEHSGMAILQGAWCIFAESSEVDMADATLLSTPVRESGAGAQCCNQGNVQLLRCRIAVLAAPGMGISIDKSQCRLEDCRLEPGCQWGVVARGDSSIACYRSTLFGRVAAFSATHRCVAVASECRIDGTLCFIGAHATLTESRVSVASGNGIAIQEQSAVLVQNCEILAKTGAALAAASTDGTGPTNGIQISGSSATLSNVKIAFFSGGLHHHGGQLSATCCTITNCGCGIGLFEGAQARLVNTKVHRADSVGLLVGGGAGAVLEDCAFRAQVTAVHVASAAGFVNASNLEAQAHVAVQLSSGSHVGLTGSDTVLTGAWGILASGGSTCIFNQGRVDITAGGKCGLRAEGSGTTLRVEDVAIEVEQDAVDGVCASDGAEIQLLRATLRSVLHGRLDIGLRCVSGGRMLAHACDVATTNVGVTCMNNGAGGQASCLDFIAGRVSGTRAAVIVSDEATVRFGSGATVVNRMEMQEGATLVVDPSVLRSGDVSLLRLPKPQ